MKRIPLLSVMLSMLLFTGCTAQASAPLQEATVEPEPVKRTAAVRPTALANNNPLPLPVASATAKPGKPWRVIEKANKSSAQNPHAYGYFNSIMNYDYVPGFLFKVYTAPLRITDIQLQPGEKIIGTPVAGDVVRWVLGTGQSVQDGKEQQHLYVKPTQPDLKTTMVITTNKRTYHIELHSYKETYMAAVTWNYPQESLALQQEREKETTETGVSIERLYFDYDIDVKKGRKPAWLPEKIFDDGRKTFIRFPEDMLNREAPVLFVMGRGAKEGQLVNYRMKNDYYVVDRLFDRAELRLGTKKQTIVEIERR